MEASDLNNDIVHPEVRAHINSLVSALGGVSQEDDGRYQLGDDALEVLRDIKRWIRFYDEKTNRMDVARCVYEANLIEGDLLPILSLWPENATDSKYKARIALSCFEVMVPLTWPIQRDREAMTINHHRHMPVLELAHVAYKRAILNFDGARVLSCAVRVALPAMQKPISERTQRDQGIIKLALFFLRNVAAIAPPPGVAYEGDESQISRSATIDAFSFQDIFHLLLMLASNMGEDFRTEDTTVMEVLYHLVKRINVKELFMTEKQAEHAQGNELRQVMRKEINMLRSQNQTRGGRNNRFGSMIWVKRDDGKMTTLTGQDAVSSAATRQRKMDEAKTFKPPRRGKKEDKHDREIGPAVTLDSRATTQLRTFVEDFLDSGFNPLFSHVRKTIDREANYLMAYHKRQFFYLVAWLLEAERMRRKAKQGSDVRDAEEVTSFNLVAGVLNQEMFITLNRALHNSFEAKEWHDLTAVMRCYTQIFMTVQEMQQCGREDDEEIAENILSRLFYEEATHDAITNIIRGYKDQGFDYLDAATELVHHFLRILESYSKQNVDMQVRSRKRTRRKKKAAQAAEGVAASDDEGDGSGNDEAAAEKTSKDRKFDFIRFASRFTPQPIVNTFVTYTKYYRDLNEDQLKRAHRFFYRIAFKQEMAVMLFRVDIIHLLYNMIKGPEALDASLPSFKEWEDLVRHIIRKCTKKLEQRPELVVEMLFSKLPSTAFFLEHGYEKQTIRTTQPKPAAELEFKDAGAMERDRQIAIVVGALLDKNQADLVTFVKKVAGDAEVERKAWQDAERIRQMEADPFDEGATESDPKAPPVIFARPDNDGQRTAMFKNSHLRLLMSLAGFKLLGAADEETRDSSWIIPSEITPDHLKDTVHFINQAEFSPPTFEEGVLADHQLKRKNVPRKKATFDDDEEGNMDNDDFLDDEMLFTAGGPTARRAEKPTKPKATRKRLQRKEQTEEELDEKARKRREREREKQARIKSALRIQDGDSDFDEEEDEAFFRREREIAAKAAMVAEQAGTELADVLAGSSKKRKSTALVDSSDEDDSDSTASSGSDGRRKRRTSTVFDEEEADGSASQRRSASPSQSEGDDEQDENLVEHGAIDKSLAPGSADEEDDDNALIPARRPRVRGGFVMDDSDDDE
ncbi:Topoisomerase 1-associated factor-like protein [Emericellopsis cladophorae]|uniref:Topoisomerase 1-associated factor 1 n=1 Tax=Emericellopsis cladophorae TaxID=2686198 RepID=A0A9Q0BFN3_9HYPO|nr:Topoisomerase 1-associated factor-like protein [Emericellopsis cladophorae]KAI6782479.1 Topoisomerase 1-associated factor-like protein [Emericellopsis cladophorae]